MFVSLIIVVVVVALSSSFTGLVQIHSYQNKKKKKNQRSIVLRVGLKVKNLIHKNNHFVSSNGSKNHSK